MRDFLWQYFSKTGEIDAYLLYKQHELVVSNAAGYDTAASDSEQGLASDSSRE
ncbi:MAG: YqzL family protein [Firmicutes bacterium]|nr:YqzL family protein [Bacillota bacterium]